MAEVDSYTVPDINTRSHGIKDYLSVRDELIRNFDKYNKLASSNISYEKRKIYRKYADDISRINMNFCTLYSAYELKVSNMS